MLSVKTWLAHGQGRLCHALLKQCRLFVPSMEAEGPSLLGNTLLDVNHDRLQLAHSCMIMSSFGCPHGARCKAQMHHGIYLANACSISCQSPWACLHWRRRLVHPCQAVIMRAAQPRAKSCWHLAVLSASTRPTMAACFQAVMTRACTSIGASNFNGVDPAKYSVPSDTTQWFQGLKAVCCFGDVVHYCSFGDVVHYNKCIFPAPN